jgi:hypothetical protein
MPAIFTMHSAASAPVKDTGEMYNHFLTLKIQNYMGRISKGILGGFSGTVGTVIGGTWKGIDYMRSQPSRRTTTSSQRQKEQQAKFGLMIKFQSTMNNLLNYSFKSYAVSQKK